LLEALYRNGEGEHALRLLTSKLTHSWNSMLESGSTITLEAWTPLYKDTEDWNHVWGAAPANVIPTLLMGVEPLEPGFALMSIRPQPGHLEHASLDLPTIRGTVHVDLKSSPERFVLNTRLPANTTAKVYLPDLGGGGPEVTVDGVKRQAVREGKFLLIEPVGSGPHTFDRGKP
jgi:alpha-L-rhamnosidase